jgi:hypothetical protein
MNAQAKYRWFTSTLIPLKHRFAYPLPRLEGPQHQLVHPTSINGKFIFTELRGTPDQENRSTDPSRGVSV